MWHRNVFQKIFFRGYNKESFSKTTTIFLNELYPHLLMVTAWSKIGFRLSNDMNVIGPMAIFPKSVLSWKIRDASDINEDSLSLFYMLEPKIDILVLGLGDQRNRIDPNLILFMKKKGINMEVFPSEQACTTYNFLVSDGRVVAGAFLPPKVVRDGE